MRMTLCVLCWNELAGCRNDVPRLPLDAFEEVYALDGGSTDGTAEFLRDAGIDVRTQRVRGYSAAYFEAFSHCTTDAVVLYHPKGTLDPACVLEFRERFERGAELVIASRNAPGARNEEDDRLLRPRKWFVQALSAICAGLWTRGGVHVDDVLHGVRGCTVDAFRRMDLEPTGLCIDLEMVIRAYRMGVVCAEFPVREHARIAGSTHFSALPTGWKLLRFLAREIVGGRGGRAQGNVAVSPVVMGGKEDTR
ncbi:hypothetical protein GGQ74_002367 [Desulfobaculum xiamenense]|uniref:Glycosyltransferase 2-like domain-containing protein n=1 Tax=Desulfobaculum xiamenense TaxID=995050 RepID=A0A846QU66_9BACT|nr:glycosyltransferase [Desulfobaculum xiamenense]NJB68694.1 hypothetical protein [Desulfobaculum xiamenense]